MTIQDMGTSRPIRCHPVASRSHPKNSGLSDPAAAAAWGMGVKSPWPFPFVDCRSRGCHRVKILARPTGKVIMAALT